MHITLTVAGTMLPATLDDTEAGRDFAALLPLTITLTDFHGIEKVGDLPRRLSTQSAPAGVAAAIGDITYYSPWGNLAIFYRPFGYTAGLVKLGHIDTDLTALTAPRDGFAVTIAAA